MDVSAMMATNNAAATQTNSKTATNKNKLDMDSFAQMLAAELKYQDPSQSTDSTQYMTQMAQFSMLEGIQSMAKSLNVSNAAAVIGKSAIYNATDASGNTMPLTGTIMAADFSSGNATYLINGGWVSQDNITNLYNGYNVDSLAGAAAMIGKSVTYQKAGSDGQTQKVDGVISSVDISMQPPTYKIGDEWIDGSQIVNISAASGT